MAKKNPWWIGGFFLIILGVLLFKIMLLPLFHALFLGEDEAPWAKVKRPYFEVGMGEIYKEVTLEEAKKAVAFEVFRPSYLPPNMSSYKIAIRTKPKNNSEVVFFTPEFPGAKPGPLEGLVISQSLTQELEKSLKTQARTLKVDSTKILFFSLKPQDGWGIFFKKNGTQIYAYWFGKKANKKELLKIGKFLILSGNRSNLNEKDENFMKEKLSKKPVDIQKAYHFAMSKPEIVSQIACYCGCVNEGHSNLKDCFIKSNQKKLVLSSHGLVCKICILEAQKVEELLEKSISLKEIRQQIDEEFRKEGMPNFNFN